MQPGPDFAGSLPKYLHTLRYLKLEQLGWQILYRLTSPKPDLRPAPPLRAVQGRWQPPAGRRTSLLGASEFLLLNQRRMISAASDWNNPAWDKLWLYNLHYFDDLNADGAASRTAWHRGLIDRWIAENPPARGVGWEPYPASVRVVNWIKWALRQDGWPPAWRQSLAVQVRSVRSRLERHLLGNHLFTNAKALVMAGLFFSGSEADRWRSTGLALVERELSEQVLADGGHFERSPMYHAMALEDVLDLINASRVYPDVVADAVVSHWREVAARMLRWSQSICHPDGEIALFNDSAFGIAPRVSELQSYAARLGVAQLPAASATVNFSDSGYVRTARGPAVLITDVAPIGPDYMPGHAHADTLSFELSLFDRRWLVDSGCSRYDVGSERMRQRGTGAHNTVVVDGMDSSEVWASFRVARRARVFDVKVSEEGRELCVSAAHDGFRRLGGNVIHRRTWRLREDGLAIEDTVEGSCSSAEAFLHLHPDVSIAAADGCSAWLRCGGRATRLVCEGGDLSIGQSTWHPEFGSAIANTRIRLAFKGRTLTTRLAWTQ